MLAFECVNGAMFCVYVCRELFVCVCYVREMRSRLNWGKLDSVLWGRTDV